MCVFAMLGALMFASKKLMEALPNIHLIGLLVTVSTIVFRKKALFPIYIYVLLVALNVLTTTHFSTHRIPVSSWPLCSSQSGPLSFFEHARLISVLGICTCHSFFLRCFSAKSAHDYFLLIDQVLV